MPVTQDYHVLPVPPNVHVAANMYVDMGFDEFGIGRPLREPLRIARANTVDAEVPAGSEVVIEGKIDPKSWQEEGPFGEFSGICEGPGARGGRVDDS